MIRRADAAETRGASERAGERESEAAGEGAGERVRKQQRRRESEVMRSGEAAADEKTSAHLLFMSSRLSDGIICRADTFTSVLLENFHDRNMECPV